MKRFVAEVSAAAILFGGIALRAQTGPQFRADPPESWESCEEMHDSYVKRFESSPGFGLSRMGRPRMLDCSGTLDSGLVRYSVESLELVGLLKLNTPVVYVPDLHGGKAAPEGFISRELTGFEKATLASFGAGKGMASARDDQSNTLVCVGALRAKDTCLTCHRDKKAGDLLGAFSYRLRPIKAPEPL